MVEQLDFMEINSLVKEYLTNQGLSETLAQFDAEINEKILLNNSKSI
jgi:hypothetical protein